LLEPFFESTRILVAKHLLQTLAARISFDQINSNVCYEFVHTLSYKLAWAMFNKAASNLADWPKNDLSDRVKR
jgi:hypothetical protein